RHTRSKRDWSSDVCSSDLPLVLDEDPANLLRLYVAGFQHHPTPWTQMVRPLRGEPPIKIEAVRAAVEGETRVMVSHLGSQRLDRSEERRVGEEGRCGGGVG